MIRLGEWSLNSVAGRHERSVARRSHAPSAPPGTSASSVPPASINADDLFAAMTPPMPARGVNRPAWVMRALQREDQRKAVSVVIELVRKGMEHTLRAIGANLSATGAFILAEGDFAPAEHLVVNFRLPWSGSAYSFFSEVIHVEPGPRGDFSPSGGFGVEFLDSSPGERARLRAELAMLPAAP